MRRYGSGRRSGVGGGGRSMGIIASAGGGAVAAGTENGALASVPRPLLLIRTLARRLEHEGRTMARGRRPRGSVR